MAFPAPAPPSSAHNQLEIREDEFGVPHFALKGDAEVLAGQEKVIFVCVRNCRDAKPELWKEYFIGPTSAPDLREVVDTELEVMDLVRRAKQTPRSIAEPLGYFSSTDETTGVTTCTLRFRYARGRDLHSWLAAAATSATSTSTAGAPKPDHFGVPVPVARHILQQILRALSFIHNLNDRELIHRDISPQVRPRSRMLPQTHTACTTVVAESVACQLQRHR